MTYMQYSFLTCNSWISASLGHLEFSLAKARISSMCCCSVHPPATASTVGVASSEPSGTVKQHIRLCLVPSQLPLTVKIVSSLTQNAAVQEGAQAVVLPKTLQSSGFWPLLIYFTFASGFLGMKKFLFMNKFFVPFISNLILGSIQYNTRNSWLE